VALFIGMLGLSALPLAAQAGIALVQPPKRIDATQPLELILLVTADDLSEQEISLPDHITVAASADMIPPVQIPLARQGDETGVRLQPGQFRKIRYRGALPPQLRGTVRIEPLGIDASPVLVAVIRPQAGQPPVPVASVSSDAASHAVPVAPAAEDIMLNNSRLSFNEPLYFMVDDSGDNTNAKFQLSFKFRLFMPDDPRSKGLLDNLYFGYTQFSLWDLKAPSAPFRDTNYRPSLYYYLSDLGIGNGVVSRVGIATGLEHESNGRDGAESRSINTYFVQPTINFGGINDYHFTVSPKIYTYLGPTRDNPDIADYRGNVDLKLSYGRSDAWQLATVLRRGRHGSAGSANTALSYPVSRLIPGTAGYLMASYFHGYGESLLTYDRKEHPQWRIGYALWR